MSGISGSIAQVKNVSSGNQIVNESKGTKPQFDPIVVPSFGKAENGDPISTYGARDKFLAMGAKEFTQSLMKEQRLFITDTSMRDAHQSLMATRLRTNDLLAVAPATNMAMANAFSVEAWGGATFDVAYRFLKESPWVRLDKLRAAMPNTLIQMLLRASNAVGYANYPDNVVKKFIEVAAERGVDVFRIFDSDSLCATVVCATCVFIFPLRLHINICSTF